MGWLCTTVLGAKRAEVTKSLRQKSRVLVAVLAVVCLAPSARATPERELIMSCTYGVLAGTLVGAASLAFVDQPGENLQHVARGASIGLYVGIGLGYYTAFVLPKQLQREEEKILNEESGEPQSSWKPRFFIFPLASRDGVEGVGGFLQVSPF